MGPRTRCEETSTPVGFDERVPERGVVGYMRATLCDSAEGNPGQRRRETVWELRAGACGLLAGRRHGMACGDGGSPGKDGHVRVP